MSSTESSVHSIIDAFISGFDVFQRLRRSGRKDSYKSSLKNKSANRNVKRGPGNRQAAQENAKQQRHEAEELRLGHSLLLGSADVRRAYDAHTRAGGPRFANGDAIAHASLAQTLLKLNAGLVGIITSFLGGSGRNATMTAPIDYRGLTSLSDVSRVEAIEALGQLYARLSTPDLRYQQRMGVAPTGRPPNRRQITAPVAGHRRNDRSVSRHRRDDKTVPVRTERSSNFPPGVAKVTVNTSHTQLAFVRPATKRKDSGVSLGSITTPRSRAGNARSASASPCHSTPMTPTLALALPAYSPCGQYGLQDRNVALPMSFDQLRLPYHTVERPAPQPVQSPAPHSPFATEHSTLPQYFPPSAGDTAAQHQSLSNDGALPYRQHAVPQQNERPKSIKSSRTQMPPPHPSRSRARASSKAPSTAPSIASSTSTKLGEIPMRRWAEPFDHAEMHRLNAEAMRWPAGVPPLAPSGTADGKGRGRFAFGRLFGAGKGKGQGKG